MQAIKRPARAQPEDVARDFTEAVLACAAVRDDASPALSRHRAVAREQLARHGLPSGKIEAWKYTPIARFYDHGFVDPGRSEAQASAPPLALTDALRVRLIDGRPQIDAASPPPGLTIAGADDAAAVVDAHLNRDIDAAQHPLGLVNLCLLESALVIHVAPGTHVERAIDLQSLNGRLGALCSRVLVVLEAGSRAHLIEQHNLEAARNQVTEIHLADGAELVHEQVQASSDSKAWQLTHVSVAAGAHYRCGSYALGGAVHRNEIHVRLWGEQAEADLQGAFVTRHRQRLDNQLFIEHVVPRCRSDQRFHGIAMDRSELTFNGRIYIHRDAQRSDARLSNKNLLAHDGAKVNTKPELEIYADDVKCAHGATVGQLSADALFYLRARGMTEATARALLLRAFIGVVLPAADAAHGDAERAAAEPIAALFDHALAGWLS